MAQILHWVYYTKYTYIKNLFVGWVGLECGEGKREKAVT